MAKRSKKRESAPADAPEVDLAPSRPLMIAVMVATLLGAGTFIARAAERAKHGETRVTEQLLRAERRDNEAPRFTLKKLDGGQVSLADYPNQIVFVNFWATWCPPCVEEMPSMERLAARFKDRPGFVFLAVSADDTIEPVQKFFDGRRPPGLTILHDPAGEVARSYGTTRFPETWVVENGRVKAFIEGPRDWDDWFAAEYVDGVLRGGTPD